MSYTKTLLASLLLLAMCAVPAFAAKCSEDGCAGASLGGGGGGDGYVQRGSGLWVPNEAQYLEESAAPIISPAAEQFGQDVLRDVAKDAVKGVGYAAIGVAFSNIKNQLLTSVHTLTLTGLRAKYW